MSQQTILIWRRKMYSKGDWNLTALPLSFLTTGIFSMNLITKIYEFDRGKVIEHLGGIYDFMAKRNWKVSNNRRRLFKIHTLG